MEMMWMYKLLQIEQVIGCFYELCITSKNFKCFQWLEAVCRFWTGGILLFIVLTCSIFVGDTRIPPYLGDGYNYDNFERKEGDGLNTIIGSIVI